MPWIRSTLYIWLPRTPVPSRHSQASLWVVSSGLASNTWSTVRVWRLPSWWQKLQSDFSESSQWAWDSMRVPMPLPSSPVPGKRLSSGGAIRDSQ